MLFGFIVTYKTPARCLKKLNNNNKLFSNIIENFNAQFNHNLVLHPKTVKHVIIK